ncbi:site-specific DNA-methyltransferase [Variovorax sp. EBFNA2]|uniref:site-specific DNA-methyltransferase n=1 Tax=Variovorax sp. EBFNA2 TaxID=3342097 RepID=UPI0029C040D5|nr:site-specific DNA-methyltransferase [Variovorax boronicumulans]WPG35330.1 site-specific DNA-methyltransferase [Variovorax boronicumulans]
MDWLNRCHFGDVRVVLRQMIADGVQVHAIVTSPPYWALRSYLPDGHADKAFEIGSEPTLQEFVATMVEVFDLCRRVLRDDGTMWMNMGDSYATASGPQPSDGGDVGRREGQKRKPARGTLKPKDLVGQPWRLAFALQDAGWWLRQDIVWHKPNPMPESAKDRCTKAHEYLFLMAKSERYYWDFDAMQEPVTGGAHARRSAEALGLKRPGFGHGYDAEAKPRYKTPDGWATHAGSHGAFHKDGREKGLYPALPPKRAEAGNDSAYGDGKSERMGRGPGWRARKLAEAGSGTKLNASFDEAVADLVATRNRRSVWTIPSEPYKGAHFATFPRALIEPCILASCPAGGIVLDPFFGSGTTGQVAQQLGRQFIGIDLNAANEPLQADRLRQQSLRLEAA